MTQQELKNKFDLDSYPNEIWKRIKEARKYFVSSKGRVFSTLRNRILKSALSTTGYPGVVLKFNEGYFKTIYVHRLVASAFCNRASNEQNQVNHKDGIKTNNASSNLEWVTQSENNIHACRVLGKISPMKGRSGSKHHNSKPIMCVETKELFSCAKEAERVTGISASNIYKCLKDDRKRAGKLHWKYPEKENIQLELKR